MVWLAHMAHTEADAIDYAWPPRNDPESQAESGAFAKAANACIESARRANGDSLPNAFWEASMEEFWTANPEWFREE